jgi:acyl-CoA reductase-like NAD-dependent aldehyde dehydrogenase
MNSGGEAAAHSFAGGQWRDGPLAHAVHYAHDGRIVARVEEATASTVEDAVRAALEAQRAWRRVPAFRRSALISGIARALAHRADVLVRALVLNSSKTLKDARSEVERTITTLEVTAEEAKRIGGEVLAMDALPPGAGRLGVVVRVPVGVVAGVTPFNAPLNLAAHKLGPAIAGGNAVVVKPHPHGAVVTNLLAEACIEAGMPAGLFNIVQGGADVGRALVSHRDVALVSFTGSGSVGEQITRQIGLKRSVMELGGNAPTLVHADADLAAAAAACAEAAFGLSGQSCVSTQRIYVHRAVAGEFLAALKADAVRRRLGDPMDEATDLAPLVNEAAAIRVEAWIREAVAGGATLVCGGRRKGASIEATVVTGVAPSMRLVCEEVFGPVVTVSPYDDLDAAIAAANASPWGFKAGIFTNAIDVAVRAARELEFGTVNVNGASRSRVDHEPSGGTKASGWGREGPRYAIEDMTHLRMISLAGIAA